MKISDIVLEHGRIVKDVNTTPDVGVDEIKIQAKKMGFDVTKDGVPPLLYEDGTYKYSGSCVNSFDEETGFCSTGIFYDVSDFAVAEENATIIPKEVFDKQVGKYKLEHSGNIEYQYYENRDVYALYDINNDIHYFFSQ